MAGDREVTVLSQMGQIENLVLSSTGEPDESTNSSTPLLPLNGRPVLTQMGFQT